MLFKPTHVRLHAVRALGLSSGGGALASACSWHVRAQVLLRLDPRAGILPQEGRAAPLRPTGRIAAISVAMHRKGVRQEPEGGDDPATWVPQHAARRDEAFGSGASGSSMPQPRSFDVRRSQAGQELVEAAAKYNLPDDAPASLANSLAQRDTGHASTLPGFAVTRCVNSVSYTHLTLPTILRV